MLCALVILEQTAAICRLVAKKAHMVGDFSFGTLKLISFIKVFTYFDARWPKHLSNEWFPPD